LTSGLIGKPVLKISLGRALPTAPMNSMEAKGGAE